ncbi:MAG: hypothetical protein M1546_05615, partial [Chloroflexi bacterium]|nr:hypothetical protein [Chloroflexota bacterium]
AGEGSFGPARESGLFPGLEFLTGAEQSSGTDFADPPANRRYVPHPNKITIPFMAVNAEVADPPAGCWCKLWLVTAACGRVPMGSAQPQHVTTGLIWDPLQRWDGIHDRPAALFASPN